MHSRRAVASLSLAVALLPCLFLVSAAQGGPQPPPTNILYGFVTTNRTLTYGYPGPVYYVPGDLVINPGITLTIEPGVTLLLAADRDTLQGGDLPGLTEVKVQGTLSATGVPGNPVQIVATAPGPGKWGQIRVAAGGTLQLQEVTLTGATTAINSSGSLSVSRLTASAVQNGALIDVPSTGRVYDSKFVGAGSGTGLLLRSGNVTAVPDSTDPRPCDVSGFTYGIRIEGAQSVSNIVSHDNAFGFYIPDGYPSVTLNYLTIARNAQSSNPSNYYRSIYCSLITNNSSWGLYLGSGFANYVDSWGNGSNFDGCCFGPLTSTFNPFYLDYAGSDFHLSSGSPFKTYGPWGAEIGAYGPGPGDPTPATSTSWGRLKATYR